MTASKGVPGMSVGAREELPGAAIGSHLGQGGSPWLQIPLRGGWAQQECSNLHASPFGPS